MKRHRIINVGTDLILSQKLSQFFTLSGNSNNELVINVAAILAFKRKPDLFRKTGVSEQRSIAIGVLFSLVRPVIEVSPARSPRG